MNGRSKIKLPWLLIFCLFFVFNTIAIFPEYYFKRATTTFLPSSKLALDPILGSLKMLFVRENADLFRVVGEIGLWMIFLSLVAKWRKRRLGLKIVFWIYTGLLIFHWYFLVSFKLYGEPTNVKNDLVLIQEVLPLFLRELGLHNLLVWFLALGVLIGIFYLIYRLIRWSLKVIGEISNKALILSSGSILLIILLLQIGVSFTFDPSKDQPTWKSVHWVIPAMAKSLFDQDSLDVSSAEKKYADKFKTTLQERPNVYWLFLESYGSVIQLLEEEGLLYDSLIMDLESQLSEDGWGIASNYSIPPVIGGRSWLSFTSAMTGLDIKNHLFFNEMLTSQYNYPHLVRYLNKQGYATYRMKTMSNQKQSTEISYALTDRFYAFDHWIKFDDIPYKGFAFDLLGGIPDQFALNYFHDSILVKEDPFFFFSINMTSHAPWFPAPPFVENYHTLNHRQEPPTGHVKALDVMDESMRYYSTIEYVLKSVVDLIVKKVDDDAMIFLVGDHQPPGMTFLCEGVINEFAVPVHIISKNRSLLDHLYKKSFEPSLKLNPNTDVKYHHYQLYDLTLDLLQIVDNQ